MSPFFMIIIGLQMIKKIGEMLYVGGGMLSLGYLASKWL